MKANELWHYCMKAEDDSTEFEDVVELNKDG